MTNTSRDHKKWNCRFVVYEQTRKWFYIQPYQLTADEIDYRHYQKRAFVVATKDIQKGEELIANYHGGYFARHVFSRPRRMNKSKGGSKPKTWSDCLRTRTLGHTWVDSRTYNVWTKDEVLLLLASCCS